MAVINAKMVKELRTATDAPMMDCKKALVETNGDLDKAIEVLRKKGIAKAGKKADRIASEGIVEVIVADDFKSATISEINSETDFVAKNEKFKSLVKETVTFYHSSNLSSIDEIHNSNYKNSTFGEYFAEETAKIGEKIVSRRFSKLSGNLVNGYAHSNGRVGVIIAIETNKSEELKDFAKDIAMHAAAMKPQYLQANEIPQNILDKEKEIAIELLKKEGKPEAMFDKIIPGKLKKFTSENTLVGQKFVKNDKLSVEKALTTEVKKFGGTAKIVGYIRYELGEGIKKKETLSFADEVAAQTGK
jgi:elongation factor Ts